MIYEDINKMFKVITKTVDGKYVMNAKDAIDFDKMLGLTRTTLEKYEKYNEKLKFQNRVVEAKCVVLESKLDQVKTNLSLALDHKADEKEDVAHLINICAALVGRESQYRYIQVENDKLKHKLHNQLIKIRVKSLNNCKEILNTVEILKEEIVVKDTKISGLMDEIHTIKTENDEKFTNVQLFHEKLFIELVNTKNELYQGNLILSIILINSTQI